MGYNLHITRRHIHEDEDHVSPISLDEWLAYVKDDPNIEIDPNNLTDPPENFIINSHPKQWPLWYCNNFKHIYTKNPDNQTIGVMVKIAVILRAKVQGDDGEYYEDDSGYPVK